MHAEVCVEMIESNSRYLLASGDTLRVCQLKYYNLSVLYIPASENISDIASIELSTYLPARIFLRF